MSPARKEQNYKLLAALLRTRKKRLVTVAATIAVALTMTAQTGAQAMEQAKQTVLYVGAPAVSEPTAREAGATSQTVAAGASPQTLVALGYSPRAVHEYAVRRALASVAAPPPPQDASITAQAALEAGNTYMAQSGRQLQAQDAQQNAGGGKGEIASMDPMRPQLGDGTVAPPQAIGAPPEKPSNTPGRNSENASSGGGSPSDPYSPHATQDIANVQAPPSTRDTATGTPDGATPVPHAMSGNADRSLKLLAEPTSGPGGANTSGTKDTGGPSMTGPIAAQEQVPTDLSGGRTPSMASPKPTTVAQADPTQSATPQPSEPQASEPQASEPQASEPQASEPQASEPQTTAGQDLAVAPAPPDASTSTDHGNADNSSGGAPYNNANQGNAGEQQAAVTPPESQSSPSPAPTESNGNGAGPSQGNDAGNPFALTPPPADTGQPGESSSGGDNQDQTVSNNQEQAGNQDAGKYAKQGDGEASKGDHHGRHSSDSGDQANGGGSKLAATPSHDDTHPGTPNSGGDANTKPPADTTASGPDAATQEPTTDPGNASKPEDTKPSADSNHTTQTDQGGDTSHPQGPSLTTGGDAPPEIAPGASSHDSQAPPATSNGDPGPKPHHEKTTPNAPASDQAGRGMSQGPSLTTGADAPPAVAPGAKPHGATPSPKDPSPQPAPHHDSGSSDQHHPNQRPGKGQSGHPTTKPSPHHDGGVGPEHGSHDSRPSRPAGSASRPSDHKPTAAPGGGVPSRGNHTQRRPAAHRSYKPNAAGPQGAAKEPQFVVETAPATLTRVQTVAKRIGGHGRRLLSTVTKPAVHKTKVRIVSGSTGTKLQRKDAAGWKDIWAGAAKPVDSLKLAVVAGVTPPEGFHLSPQDRAWAERELASWSEKNSAPSTPPGSLPSPVEAATVVKPPTSSSREAKTGSRPKNNPSPPVDTAPVGDTRPAPANKDRTAKLPAMAQTRPQPARVPSPKPTEAQRQVSVDPRQRSKPVASVPDYNAAQPIGNPHVPTSPPAPSPTPAPAPVPAPVQPAASPAPAPTPSTAPAPATASRTAPPAPPAAAPAPAAPRVSPNTTAPGAAGGKGGGA